MTAEPFTQSIRGCARCWGEGHEDVLWQPLTHPVDDPDGEFTHWAPCPTNGEPILMRVTAAPSEKQAREFVPETCAHEWQTTLGSDIERCTLCLTTRRAKVDA